MTTITQKAVNGLDYSLNTLPTTISGFRMIDAGVKLGDLYDVLQVSGLELKSLGAQAKVLDNICYLTKFVEAADKFVKTAANFDTTKKTASTVKIVFAAIKVVGHGAASMRFFVGMGMTFYVGKTNLMYIKNVCSVISAGKFFYDAFTNKEKRKEDGFALMVFVNFGSMWLNGVGGIVSWVGKEALIKAGGARIPEPMWPIIAMATSASGAAKAASAA